MTTTTPFSYADFQALSWAVRTCANSKQYYSGAQMPTYEKKLKEARSALRKVRAAPPLRPYSQNVEAAMGKIVAMKTGAVATTKELSKKHGIQPYAFKAAAHKLENENVCRLRNANRINTITRV